MCMIPKPYSRPQDDLADELSEALQNQIITSDEYDQWYDTGGLIFEDDANEDVAPVSHQSGLQVA